MPYSTINVRVDADLKEQFSQLASEMGLSMSAAINVFLKASVNRWGLPFELEGVKYNEETVKAMEDVTAGRGLSKVYTSVEELMEDLNA